MDRDKRRSEAEVKGVGSAEAAKKECDDMKGNIKNMILN